MGCHGSKQARRDLLRSPSPLPRSNSMPEKNHLVSLTSSTLGSLNLVDKEEKKEEEEQSNGGSKNNEISIELANARSWSAMIDTKIARTPTETPPNEPEPIDALELMAGLEADYSPLDRRSFSFFPIGHFDRARKLKPECELGNVDGGKRNAVVFYFTSLKGVRKTYEDCCLVRTILDEYGVRVDERDVSMHSGFKEALKEIVQGGGSLPRVFVNKRELGGAEEVRRMHERGELEKVLKGCGIDFREKGETGEECNACGDVRFVMCVHCSGSCRVYCEEEEEEEGGGGWRRCSECNENGIVRCPVCCQV